MISMPDTIEEVFQQAVSMRMASDASARLRESVDRLSIEENLEADISEEMDQIGVHIPITEKVTPMRRRTAARPSRSRNSVSTSEISVKPASPAWVDIFRRRYLNDQNARQTRPSLCLVR